MLSFICSGHCCQDVSAYPPTSGEQPSGVGIHGISARKVYPLWPLLTTAVGSYPTFSSSPQPPEEEEEAVIFCGTVSFFFQRSRLLTGALLCAVRTFLPPL